MTGRAEIDELLERSDIDSLQRPTHLAEGLPGRVFTDPDFFELEARRLFGRSWTAVGFGADIPNPGDVTPVSLAGYELLLVRGSDGDVRCFHNICRHRGMKLVSGKSHVSAIRCGWHSWTYDLEGALVATPNIAGIRSNACEGFDKDKLGLREVRSAKWFDIIFVDLSGQASPLEQQLAPLSQRLSHVQFDQCRTDGVITDSETRVNWKVIIEGGIEDYHLPFVHKSLTYSDTYKFEDGGAAYLGFSTSRPVIDAVRRYNGESTGGERALPVFPNLRDRQEVESAVLFIMPNAIVAAIPTHVRLSVLLPQGPAHTIRRQCSYFVGDAGTAPEYAELRQQTHDFWREIWEEDGAYMNEIQHMSSVRDRLGMTTRFSPHWERGVHAFQKYLLAQVI